MRSFAFVASVAGAAGAANPSVSRISAASLSCNCAGNTACLALEAFYVEFKHDGRLEGWCDDPDHDPDPCTWATTKANDVYIGCEDTAATFLSSAFPGGVEASRNVVELRIRNQKLTGTIPDVLGDLAGLKVLDLSNNTLTGAVPASLAQLGNLESLSLQHNTLSELPPELCDSTAFKQQGCDLTDNQFEAMDECFSETICKVAPLTPTPDDPSTPDDSPSALGGAIGGAICVGLALLGLGCWLVTRTRNVRSDRSDTKAVVRAASFKPGQPPLLLQNEGSVLSDLSSVDRDGQDLRAQSGQNQSLRDDQELKTQSGQDLILTS